MRYLSIQKIPVIPLKRVIDYLYHGVPLPERSVVITIDDGYKTALTIAQPILARYGFTFTEYIYPHAISRLPGSLSWGEVMRLDDEGVDIQSHTLTHPLLTHPPHAMGKAEYVKWLDKELFESKKIIEEKLGKPVDSLAYSYGGYDERVVERAKAAGYKVALTCDDGDVSGFTSLLLLNRRLVFAHTRKREFSRMFLNQPLEVADLSPRDGERVKIVPTEIRARIVHPERIRLDTAKILVDKLGGRWKPVSIDPKTGIMSLPVPDTPRRGYFFVSLSAQDRQNSAIQHEASWLFIIRKNASKK